MPFIDIANYNQIISVLISSVALIISLVALLYTVKAFLLKSGAYIRGTYSLRSSISCDDKYIGSLTLENFKDKAIIIYKIYLRLGHRYYIEIDNFEKIPMVLKPFEVFKKDYDPIDLYSTGTSKITINTLLDNKHVKQKIILSTSEGKYIVKKGINYWDPISDFFRNHMTRIIYPLRIKYEGISYGSNSKYIVELKMVNGKNEIFPIYDRDYERKKFKHFQLTKESLESEESLKNFLLSLVDKGQIKCVDIEVFKYENWYNDEFESISKKAITAQNTNWFNYHIVGRIYTFVDNFLLRKHTKLQSKRKD